MFSQNGWMPIIAFIVIVFFSDKYVLVLVELWLTETKVFLKVAANVSKHEHETQSNAIFVSTDLVSGYSSHGH